MITSLLVYAAARTVYCHATSAYCTLLPEPKDESGTGCPHRLGNIIVPSDPSTETPPRFPNSFSLLRTHHHRTIIIPALQHRDHPRL